MPSKTRYAAECEIQAGASVSAALGHETTIEQVALQLRACEDFELEQSLLERRRRLAQERDAERASARYMHEKAESAASFFGTVSMSHGEVAESATILAQRKKSTLRQPDQVALDASADRKRLLVGQPIEDAVAIGLDVAASVGARSSVQIMLSHQIAALHRAGMQSLEDGIKQPDVIHKTRLLNTAARCMTAFQSAALTLQRLQQGVRQDVHVRHVHIHENAQAVIGNVETGGSRPLARGG